MSKIGIIYSDRYLDHETGTHVENSSRLTAIRDALLEAPWTDSLEWIEPRAATVDEVALIHDKHYISYVKRACENTRGISFLNPDTAVSYESYNVAMLAAGGVCDGIKSAMKGDIAGFFALVRPPGHHAEADESLGFCLFNNIAIGARYAQDALDAGRVFILDWDVHHGNGTQHSFQSDPSVFFCSFHQYPHYPGTGGKNEMGVGDGLGYTINLPMRAGSGNDDYTFLMEECVCPAIQRYNPELLLISAGFDAHKGDPLGAINLTEDGYAAIFELARSACGPDCRAGLVLEGGYELSTLASSVTKVTGVFAGEEQVSFISDVKSPTNHAVELARFIKENHPILKNS
ncbi:MAG: histone deacetylase [bacterium]